MAEYYGPSLAEIISVPDRQRAWLAPPVAATLIDEPELASLVGSLTVPLEHR